MLEIKDLPPGKPADFSGGIGQFKLDVEAEPRRAQAGDPVTVRLLLSGQGNFDRISPPVLSDEHGLKTYPPSAKFKADDDVGLSGVKTFEQVVIADGARTSLPAYRFNYLDPATGKYVVAGHPAGCREDRGQRGDSPPPAVAALPSANASSHRDARPRRPRAPPRTSSTFATTPASPADRSAFLPVYERRDVLAGAGRGTGGVARGGGRTRAARPGAERSGATSGAAATRAGRTPARLAQGGHRPPRLLPRRDPPRPAPRRRRADERAAKPPPKFRRLASSIRRPPARCRKFSVATTNSPTAADRPRWNPCPPPNGRACSPPWKPSAKTANDARHFHGHPALSAVLRDRSSAAPGASIEPRRRICRRQRVSTPPETSRRRRSL